MPKASKEESGSATSAKKPYVDPRTKWRTELTIAFEDKLARLTGHADATMAWTIEGYAETIVRGYGLKLVGWPENVNFADLSRVRGGSKTLEALLKALNSDELKFEEASALEKLNAALDPTSVAPAKEFVHCKPPTGRSDIGRARYRWKTNPDSKPLRRPKDGPKSDKFAVDSDSESDSSRPRLN